MDEKKLSNTLHSLLRNREAGLLIILFAIAVILSITTTTFLSIENMLNVVRQVTLVTIVAAGQTLVITSGGIDLSVGSVLGISSVIMSLFISLGVPVGVAVAVCLLCGMFFGLLNGILITRLSLPPFIVTLGMMSVARGIVHVITKGYPIMVDSPFIMQLGQGSWGVLPIMILFMPVVVIFMHWLFNYTVFGNHVKAIGGNETASRLSGINVHRSKVLVFGLCGFLCGLAGLIMTGRLNSGNPNAGLNFEMDTIAAVIVGGTLLSGGSGTVIGTMLGALLLGVIRNGLVLLSVNMYWQTVATGMIIILVCAIEGLSKSKGTRS